MQLHEGISFVVFVKRRLKLWLLLIFPLNTVGANALITHPSPPL